ncbi:MAG: helix-turn-helix transcriptional regulator [Solirubrobacterales bacterium]
MLGLTEQLQPTTPYDLKQAAAVSVTNFWSLPHTQLYLECGRLAEGGYLSERREEFGRRRRIYRLTRKGSDALVRWRSEASGELYELRDAGILKLYFGAEPSQLAKRQADAHKRKLGEYETRLAELKRVDAPRQVTLAIEAGIGHEREYVRFWSKLMSDAGATLKNPPNA